MKTQNTATLPKKAPVFLPTTAPPQEEMQKNREINSEIW